MGDGDCGEAVVGMCQGVLKKLDAGLCKEGYLFPVLDEVGEAVEEIGGTLGAIISIIVASFTLNLREDFAKNESSFTLDSKSTSAAVGKAIKNLMGYTSARQGGRTVMDTLIPFSETFEKTSDLGKAVDAADEGAKTTSGMNASFGRGMYLLNCEWCASTDRRSCLCRRGKSGGRYTT
jgi:triose/dihydroxyacetone kinase / FAD-AMP lyase (cyclizing)